MSKSSECFQDILNYEKCDYVIHTACPFMEGLNVDQHKSEIKNYTESTKGLLQKSIENKNTLKFVMTGSASSIVGQAPEKDKIYSNPLEWADIDLITKPNERAKILAERQTWARVTKAQNDEDSNMKLTTILPYFMIGPPLIDDHI